MIVVLLRVFSQLSLTCLSLGSMTWLHRHLLSISSNWIHLWWGCLWLSGRFRLLLMVLWLTIGTRPCRSFSEPFWRDFRRWLHYLSPLGAKRNLHKSASFSPQKRGVYTHRLLFSALDILSREIVNIGCHRLGKQLEETLLLRRLIKLFGVLGSEKWFRSDSAAGLVQIEVCRLGLHLGTLLLRCTLFWLFGFVLVYDVMMR